LTPPNRTPEPLVSVLMPVWNRAHFVPRAIESVRGQTLDQWELIVIDDGSTDEPAEVIKPYLTDARVRYVRLPQNRGLGAALNIGFEQARASRIAYLPSDDVYYSEHLASLARALDECPRANLAFSGARHHYNRDAMGVIDGYSLQLVQVMHRRTARRWIEREELVTDDLSRMLWNRLQDHGSFVGSGRVTCEWVDHPDQLHKLLREPVGGINPFRQRFAIQHPLRFHTSVGNPIDEPKLYAKMRVRPETPRSKDGLNILLVGELAYNADRVLALEERGHRLFGLWMREPYWYNSVGPLPFGHVEDIPHGNWRERVRKLKPDVIYALLNWQTVPFAHEAQSQARYSFHLAFQRRAVHLFGERHLARACRAAPIERCLHLLESGDA